VAEDEGVPVRAFGITVYPGDEDRSIVSLNDVDRERVLHEVRNATDQGDYVVANSHSHEPGNAFMTPPDWMVEFARQVIDAGAATFIIHGPHQLRGVEIHNSRPIFYSLGDFIFQNETIDPMPSDQRDRYGLPLDRLASEIYDTRFRVDEDGNPTTGFPTESRWYESVVPVVTFEDSEAVEIVFHPIELGWKAPRSQRGTPRIAPERIGRIYPYLQQGNSRHRYWAARALGYARDQRSRAQLEQRRTVESDDRVLAAIDASLAKMVQ